MAQIAPEPAMLPTLTAANKPSFTKNQAYSAVTSEPMLQPPKVTGDRETACLRFLHAATIWGRYRTTATAPFRAYSDLMASKRLMVLVLVAMALPKPALRDGERATFCPLPLGRGRLKAR